jgi:hypothetical protein
LLAFIFPADPGQTYNTSQTLKRLIATDPQVLILLADFTYADNWKNANQFTTPEADPVTCKCWYICAFALLLVT